MSNYSSKLYDDPNEAILYLSDRKSINLVGFLNKKTGACLIYKRSKINVSSVPEIVYVSLSGNFETLNRIMYDLMEERHV